MRYTWSLGDLLGDQRPFDRGRWRAASKRERTRKDNGWRLGSLAITIPLQDESNLDWTRTGVRMGVDGVLSIRLPNDIAGADPAPVSQFTRCGDPGTWQRRRPHQYARDVAAAAADGVRQHRLLHLFSATIGG